MKRFLIIFFLFFVFCMGFFSCKKDKSVGLDFGYNYFPDKVGSYVIYDVDSFYYDDFFFRTDTSKFQIKEKIHSIYLDNQNRPTIRLERYYKKYDVNIPYNLIPWQLIDVWVENKLDSHAEKVEENVRFVKLVFPIKESQTWNGNAQNTLADWTYSYDFFDQARWVGGIHFDSVLQVNQYDDKGKFIQQRQLYTEKYARNVGLVYKQVIDIKSQMPSTATPAQLLAFYAKPILDRATSGFKYTFTINSYGTEP